MADTPTTPLPEPLENVPVDPAKHVEIKREGAPGLPPMQVPKP